MADNSLNKRFYTNTYVTGSGRQNYLRIDNLEDPLFTSFTFDIDYVTSPLFYTINYTDYGYPNVEGLTNNIETALKEMYKENMGKDLGYDILPVLSASILDGNKLGFGLQQNVYMDLPLYGATEYIYMVDKRNGGASQNDVRYDSNRFPDSGSNPNTLNSYKLGDTVKEIVNDSDKAWAENKKKQNNEQISACNVIMKDKEQEHNNNLAELNTAIDSCNGITTSVEGVEGRFTEAQLSQKVNELKKLSDEFENFRRELVAWVNDNLSDFQRQGMAIYNGNDCVKQILSYKDLNSSTKEKYADELKKRFGEEFRKKYLFSDKDSYMQKFYELYNKIETYSSGKPSSAYLAFEDKSYEFKDDDKNSFLLDRSGDKDGTTVRQSKIIEKFKDKLEYFGMLKDGAIDFDINVYVMESPEWAYESYESYLSYFDADNGGNHNFDKFIKWTMGFKCDIESAFDEEKFVSDKVKANNDALDKYEAALDDIRYDLYGTMDNNKYDMNNPDPESPYGKYLAAKEKCENDDYAQAEKAKMMAESGNNELTTSINRDANNQKYADENYKQAVKMDSQPLDISRTESIAPAQTVLDMLGFISGMKKMTMDYPYIIQGITGLDTAYKNHYMIKDGYLGSGDDKITLTCLESLDLRVSSMFNRYFNAVYDRQYRRERVPINLRRFNCSVYVHDVRNFVAKMRLDKYGNHKVTYNRILELTDMYHSVIEFRFYDCEIVPEETGNIFNDISNEAPSEMKKTTFAFKYGNCVVNFVPPSEVAAHNAKNN